MGAQNWGGQGGQGTGRGQERRARKDQDLVRYGMAQQINRIRPDGTGLGDMVAQYTVHWRYADGKNQEQSPYLSTSCTEKTRSILGV